MERSLKHLLGCHVNFVSHRLLSVQRIYGKSLLVAFALSVGVSKAIICGAPCQPWSTCCPEARKGLSMLLGFPLKSHQARMCKWAFPKSPGAIRRRSFLDLSEASTKGNTLSRGNARYGLAVPSSRKLTAVTYAHVAHEGAICIQRLRVQIFEHESPLDLFFNTFLQAVRPCVDDSTPARGSVHGAQIHDTAARIFGMNFVGNFRFEWHGHTHGFRGAGSRK